MAKQHRQNKVSKTIDGNVSLEENIAIDDSLLPSATELKKLQEIDPNIVAWIMERTEIEQNARIKNNNDFLEINKKNVKSVHTFNFMSLIFGFVLFVITMSFSAFFVYKGLPTTGTIFGSTIIIIGIVYFVKILNTSHKDNP